MLRKLSIGLMSGDCDGHGNTVIFSSSKNCFATRAVCFGSLTVWKIKSSLLLLRVKGNRVLEYVHVLKMVRLEKNTSIPYRFYHHTILYYNDDTTSDNNTFCQSSLAQCLWVLANASRLFRFLGLSSGFFWCFRPLKLKSSNLLLTVLALICISCL